MKSHGLAEVGKTTTDRPSPSKHMAHVEMHMGRSPGACGPRAAFYSSVVGWEMPPGLWRDLGLAKVKGGGTGWSPEWKSPRPPR